MKQSYLHGQRGAAMLIELVLVAAVLALIGLAVYQSNHRPEQAASVQKSAAAPSTAEGLAAAAAAVTEQEPASDATLSAGAEATANELSQVDADVDSLGSAADATF